MLHSMNRQIEFAHNELLSSDASVGLASKQVVHIKWTPPPHNVFKLNTDEYHSQRTHFSACGGLIRNADGQFISGFYYNLGVSTSTVAEILGLIHGLRMGKSLHLDRVIA